MSINYSTYGTIGSASHDIGDVEVVWSDADQIAYLQSQLDAARDDMSVAAWYLESHLGINTEGLLEAAWAAENSATAAEFARSEHSGYGESVTWDEPGAFWPSEGEDCPF